MFYHVLPRESGFHHFQLAEIALAKPADLRASFSREHGGQPTPTVFYQDTPLALFMPMPTETDALLFASAQLETVQSQIASFITTTVQVDNTPVMVRHTPSILEELGQGHLSYVPVLIDRHQRGFVALLLSGSPAYQQRILGFSMPVETYMIAHSALSALVNPYAKKRLATMRG